MLLQAWIVYVLQCCALFLLTPAPLFCVGLSLRQEFSSPVVQQGTSSSKFTQTLAREPRKTDTPVVLREHANSLKGLLRSSWVIC